MINLSLTELEMYDVIKEALWKHNILLESIETIRRKASAFTVDEFEEEHKMDQTIILRISQSKRVDRNGSKI